MNFNDVNFGVYKNTKIKRMIISSYLFIKQIIFKTNTLIRSIECEDKKIKDSGLFDREEWKKYWEEWEEKDNSKYINKIV